MLRPLRLPPGIERNNTPYDTPNRWWDMNQVRWQSGTMQPVGGWSRVTSSPLDSAVRKIVVWRNNANNRNLISGTDNKLYVNQSGVWTDITPVGFVPPSSIGVGGGFGTGPFGAGTFGTQRTSPSPVYAPYAYYSFGHWGEDLVFTANSDGRLFYYTQSTPTVAPVVIAGAPVGNHGVVVTNERHVMAFGIGGDGRAVGWSDGEDYNDWNFSSTTNTAGTFDVTSKSPLLTGVLVKGGVLAFSHTDVFLIQYVGSSFGYGGQDPIADTMMFNPNTIATFGDGNAVWFSGLGFQLFSGGFVQPLPCPILNDILQGMDPLYGPFRAHAAKNGVFPEVWFFWPSVGQTECDSYAVWNYEDNIWTWGKLSRSAMVGADAYKLPYMGAPDGNIYQHEDGWLAAGMSRVGTIFAETGALGDNARTMSLQQLRIATGKGANAVTVELFGRDTPEGTEYTFGAFTPRDDGYTDARCEAMALRLRLTNAIDGPFGVGTIYADMAPGSAR